MINNFSKFKDKNITFVEIGVYNGGSLKIWKNYFGPKSRIIGIDINPDCKKFEDDIWCQLYELGYRHFNIGDDFRLPYDKDDSDKKQIDVCRRQNRC